jgi:hypothetical protein
MAKPEKSVQELLSAGGNGPITTQSLAKLLEVGLPEIQSLIDNEYLRVIFNKESFPATVVACPGDRGLIWLRQMFRPFYLRPMIKLVEVREMIEQYRKKEPKRWEIDRWAAVMGTLDFYRKLCFEHRIPIYHDEEFGELLTIEGFGWLLLRLRTSWQKRGKKDQASLLAYLLNTLPDPQLKPKDPLEVPRYSAQLSKEINRIARLPIEQRTIMALNLYQCWKDARTVQECLIKLKDLERYLEKDNGGPGSGHRRNQYAFKCGPRVAEVMEFDRRIERLKDQVTTVE